MRRARLVSPWRSPWPALALVALMASAACSDDPAGPPTTTVRPGGTEPPASIVTTTTARSSPTTLATATTLPVATTTYTVADGLPTNEVLSVDVNEDGTAWATVRQEIAHVGVVRLEGGRWAAHDPAATLAGDVELAAGPNGTAWVIGTGFAGPVGLWEFDGDDWIVHADCTEQGLERGDCRRDVTEPTSGAVGGDGDFWAQGFYSEGEVYDCGFLRREGDGWATFGPPEGGTEGWSGFCPGSDFAPDGHPHALRADGLYRLDDNGWTKLADTGGTPEFRDLGVAEWAVGANDVVWVIRFEIADLSLVWERFDGETWTTLPIGIEGLGDLDIDRDCVLEEDPSLDPADLDRILDDPIDRAYFLNSRLAPLAVDPGGGVWTSIRCSGALLTDPGDGSVAETLTTADGLPSLRITDLEVGPDGVIWIATLDGLTRVVR